MICEGVEGGRGTVKFVYTPAHRGIAPSCMADAIAKSYLSSNVEDAVLNEVQTRARHVTPYLYGEGRTYELDEDISPKRVNIQVREGVMNWVNNKNDNMLQWDKGVRQIWEEVLERVRRGGADEAAVIEALKEGDEVGHLRARQKRRARICLLYTSPSPRDGLLSRMPSSA